MGNCNSTFKWGLRFVALLFAVLLQSVGTNAQTITIDGDPSDWNTVTGLPTFVHVVDAWNVGTDNQFTQGSKDFMLGADQRWSLSPVSNKTDIANAAAVIIGCNLYFAGDRLSTSGNANIGFWFYRNGTTPQINPVTGAKDFAPEHVVGDILVIGDFSNGGTVSLVTVYKWVGTGGAFGGGTLDLVSEINASVAQNNVYSHPIPIGWSYIAPDYPTNSFYEGFVDLCILPLDDYCFSSFLLETRNSDAINAMLGDFVAGDFGAIPDITAVGGEVCEPGGPVVLCAVSTDPTLTYKWYTDAELTALVPGTMSKCITVNVTETTTFWVTATNELECTSGAVSATATVYPSVPCSIEGSLEVCPNGEFTYTGPADMVSYVWTVTGNATIPGTKTERMVTILAGQNCEDFTISLTTTDIHGCISNCQLPVNVNDVVPPVMANCPQLPVALPCNPAPALYAPSLVQAWSDVCGIASSTVTTGTPVADAQGCGWSVTHIYYAIDYCGNEATCEQVFTWKVDVIAPAIVDIADYQLAECNAPWPALLATTWTDNCGVGGLTSGSLNSDAGVNVIVDNCIQTRLYTFTATDDCGNIATKTVTVSRKYDMTAPAIVDIADYQLAECNAPWPALLSTTWTDNCGVNAQTSGSLNSNAGVNVIVDACIQTRLYTFTATDDCGNIATQTVTVSRKYDMTAPAIVDIADYQLAACNAPWPALLATTWTDNCGVGGLTSGSLNSNAGVNVIVDACIQTRLYTFTATDDCGNIATQTVTVSRKYDMTAPAIVDIADYQLAACNAPWPALLTTTWTDNCGVNALTSGSLSSNGGVNVIVDNCIQTRLYTFTATDDCGNVATQTVTVSRKYDVTAPAIVDIADYQLAACNAPWPALLATTWTDNCGVGGLISGSLSSNAGVNVIVGVCIETRLYSFTATDDCGNIATQTVTVSRKYDMTAPAIVDIADYQLAECNAPWPALLATTWTDNCGVGGLTSGRLSSDAGVNVIVDNCIQTRLYTFTATDDCGNIATQTVTVSRKYDMTAPAIVDIADYQLAECNAPWPALLATTWTDNCGVNAQTSGSLNSNAGVNVIVDNCIQTRLYTFTATDDCGNIATQTVTVSRKYDMTAPVVVDIADYMLAACNAPWPLVLTTSWTDNCGVNALTSGSLSSNAGVNVIVDNCIQTRLYTFTSTDDCGNIATQTVTVSRKYDMTAPAIVDIADYQLAACNAPWPALLATTWTDNCGVNALTSGSLSSNAGVNVIVDNCIQTRLYTFTATDDCGNIATQTVTVSRKYDMTAPVVVDIADYMLAACNAPWPLVLATTWTDNCGINALTSGTLNSNAGVNVIVNNCIQTRLYTFTATDDCGNIATQTVTVSRKYDVTPPVIVAPADYIICVDPLPLTLNATWTDNCDAGGTLTATGVFFSKTECTTTFAYIFSVTDECGNTATETVYVTRETEVYDNCETAFGFLNNSNSRCFLKDGFDRWGWTTKVSPGTEPIVMTLYAGAAKCDIAKGTDVGTVVITYNEGNVNVEYVMKDGFALSEVHVYIGCDPYPTIKGTKTVAPGQYTFNADNLDHVNGMTVDFTDVTGDVYIIAHAVTCEIECRCSEKDYSGNGVTFDAVNLGIDCPVAQVATTKKISTMDNRGTSPLSAYPNPFENKITFEFTSGQDAHAVLEIHNLLGQRVATLLDRTVKEGVLNKVDYLPVNQLPGIYTYRLMLDNALQTGKIVYNKNN